MKKSVIFSLCFFAHASSCLAVESRANREDIVSARARRLSNLDITKKYFSIGGSHNSDQNSKEYHLTSKYFYQSSRLIEEIDFRHDVAYSGSSASSSSSGLTQKTDLYDGQISSKLRISNTNNYGVFYHRTAYDPLSKYYRDSRTALGFGHIFFGDKIEFDTSVGYHDVKTYGHEIDFVSSVRANLRLTRRLTFNQRGYWFLDHESMDSELKTSLIYRVSQKLSFELRHAFEKRRYEDDNVRSVENQVSRTITVGLIFDLD